MGDVSPLRNANAEPNEDVVAVLQRALELAMAGELRSIAVVGARVGNLTWTHYHTKDNVELLGLLAFLQYNILASAPYEEGPDATS